jgi:hypothetical protein
MERKVNYDGSIMAKRKLVFMGVGFLVVVAAVLTLYPKNKPLQEAPYDFSSSRLSNADSQSFLAGNFAIITDMKKLPRPVLNAYTERGGWRLTMANPGKRFNATDVIYDSSVPRKRLIFAGVSEDKCFVHYEEGGFAHSYVLALYKFRADRIEATWQGFCHGAVDLQNLRTSVTSGRCSNYGQ